MPYVLQSFSCYLSFPAVKVQVFLILVEVSMLYFKVRSCEPSVRLQILHLYYFSIICVFFYLVLILRATTIATLKNLYNGFHHQLRETAKGSVRNWCFDSNSVRTKKAYFKFYFTMLFFSSFAALIIPHYFSTG